jgi:hypothetical protein
MANLVNVADGNFTAAATWGLVDHALISTNTGATALTTGNLDSATFVPSANVMIGVALRLASRAAGAPTNTITVTLRNSTTATDVQSVTANVSDLPAATAGADSEGGWHFFKFNATHTPNGADSYVIRCTLSSTSTAVSLATNGVANNWQRLLVRQTTQAPAAGDDLYMAQTLDGTTNPATVVARSVTMNSTAATDYGTAVVNKYQTALCVSKACTLSYGTAAATNYILRISGTFSVFSGGVFNIGSSGAEIPRDSTAVLEFDNAADGQFGLRITNLGTFRAQGLSRSSGKDVWMCRLNADEAVASTTMDVDTDTGWLNGDEVLIASTSRTAAQSELRSLNANALAASFTISAGLTNAKDGTGDYLGEIFLLTRNVEIRSVTSTNGSYADFLGTGVVDCKWMRWRYGSSISNFFTIATTTGTVDFEFCVFRDFEQGFSTTGNHGGWTFDKCVLYVFGGAGNAFTIAATNLATWSLLDVVFIACNVGVTFSDIGGTIGNLWFISNNNGLNWQESFNNAGTNGPTFVPGSLWTFHSNGTGGSTRCMGITANLQHLTFPEFYMWRNNADPIEVDLGNSVFDTEFTGNFFGNGSPGTEEPCCFLASRQNAIGDLRFRSCNISGDTAFQSNWGILFDGHSISACEVQFIDCVFSENVGTRRPLLVADIGAIPDINSGGMILQGIADNCMFGAPESIKFFLATGPNPQLASKYTYVLCPRYNQSATAHRMYTANGTIILDTNRQNIQPIGGAAIPVDSNGFRRNTGFLVAVNSGGTVTVDVDVEIDAGYNGSTDPQLVLLANQAAGIAETVLDTHSGAVGTENLSGTTAAVAADCVLEFVVRCYGTAGNAWADNWATAAAGQDTTGFRYWFGQPITNANTTGGGGGGGEHSAVF